jgi:ankyrin repeat protein
VQDNEEFVKLLISKGADVNILSGQGFSPLYSVYIYSTVHFPLYQQV